MLTEIKAGAASRGKRKRSRSIRVPFGKRAKLGGRLSTADGNPIAGSEVLVFSRDQRPDAQWTAVAAVNTSAKGYFGYRAPRGASRTIRFRFSGTAPRTRLVSRKQRQRASTPRAAQAVTEELVAAAGEHPGAAAITAKLLIDPDYRGRADRVEAPEDIDARLA